MDNAPPTKFMKEVRITWKILGLEGSSRWYAEFYRPWLESLLPQFNLRYGVRTHWIEERVT